MGLRITTWNVNGIRNPFGYQPWRDKRTFQAMFDILSADIVVFQETKIQRKDLTDDMVLVPGWDCYFSLPKHKKGYSGVVIYTRQSVCCPIRAEEGLTGALCPPNSLTPFRELPPDQQIGGYPTEAQLATSVEDASTLDSEGRCVILEFPAFVLIGVYSPANRDETRDDFRLGFLNILDARVRNLVSSGKRVFLTGDLNISREELDAANAEASMRKQGLTGLEFVTTPARRLFNQLLDGGKVFGERDEGRETPVVWDICRAYHPSRPGMFTCWEQKTNARPANCGARIDYVLCSLEMKNWFSDSNIQEGLMGSDHCPVYAIFKDTIAVEGQEHHLLDLMNPPGIFLDGKRQREYSPTTDPLPTSGRLIPEFFGRRNIRDMFARKPSAPAASNSDFKSSTSKESPEKSEWAKADLGISNSTSHVDGAKPSIDQNAVTVSSPIDQSKKRSFPSSQNGRSLKRTKSNVTPQPSAVAPKGQKSLKGFFKPKTSTAPATDTPEENPAFQVPSEPTDSALAAPSTNGDGSPVADVGNPKEPDLPAERAAQAGLNASSHNSDQHSGENTESKDMDGDATVHDPIESKESWSKLFSKPVAPRCESHNEPCITLLTKKPGMNLGRSFWMCPRPLGPSGAKEHNTQWRCHTFIWCSDWNSSSANGNG